MSPGKRPDTTGAFHVPPRYISGEELVGRSKKTASGYAQYDAKAVREALDEESQETSAWPIMGGVSYSWKRAALGVGLKNWSCIPALAIEVFLGPLKLWAALRWRVLLGDKGEDIKPLGKD